MDDTDRISSLPDEILCHILSFLPTVDSVSTSVLSKRWNPLWRSVPTFHFSFINFKVDELRVSSFFRSVNAFLHSRDLETPLKTFHLLYYPFRDDSSNIKTWLNYATTQGRVELLQLHFEELLYLLPSSVLACKTLVVLKLKHLILKDLSSVDLPNLKILRLELVDFSEGAGLAQLLSGCPNLEDLKTLNIFSGIPGKFTRLTKLVNANTKSGGVPFEVVNNVRFLSTRWIEKTDQIPEFPNLTHIELFSSTCTKDWNDVLKMLENSPRLQILVIIKEDHDFNDDEPEVCPYPESVPECISSYLRICCLTSFVSCQGDYQFARYILQNARHLQRMEITFRFYLFEDLRHIEELSLIPRCSENCTLSFA